MSYIRRIVQYASTLLYFSSLIALFATVVCIFSGQIKTDDGMLTYTFALFSVVAMLASSVLRYTNNIFKVGTEIATDSEKAGKNNKVKEPASKDLKAAKQDV